jgi:hypothetical protein
MQSKILLFALSVAAFSSCSTAYKTGQTPDDVYYSPVKVVQETSRTERREEPQRYTVKSDYEITMGIRDRRWRDFRDDYDYDNSPYNYCYCNCKNSSYYYNPYYYPWAIYTTRVTYTTPVNTTPRMVNLNTYNGYSTRVAVGKTNGTSTFSNPSSQYNNSNRSSSRVNNTHRQTTVEPLYTPQSNNTRTYTPSSNNNNSSGSSSSGSSSSGSSSGGSRPARGG